MKREVAVRIFFLFIVAITVIFLVTQNIFGIEGMLILDTILFCAIVVERTDE